MYNDKANRRRKYNRGSHTKRALRDFDRAYTITTPTLTTPDNEDVGYSLNKKRFWELLDKPAAFASDNNITLCVEREHFVRYDTRNYKTLGLLNSSPGYFYAQGRNWKRTDTYGSDNTNECRITMPLTKGEYPLNREYRTGYYSACMHCFRFNGRIWQLKGAGTKSRKKCKGMRKFNEVEKRNDFVVSPC
mmetsp:Transcript_15829/g.17585  ORF Transcript_15829/g.17585 Transcript_15829/m.17585 type:complete len:190 (-) Transcript_15829:78-647(-)